MLIRGLCVGQLEALAAKMRGKALSELSSLEASGLIGMLQSLKAGKTYRLEPDKKFTPKVTVEPPLTRAQEYGLR